MKLWRKLKTNYSLNRLNYTALKRIFDRSMYDVVRAYMGAWFKFFNLKVTLTTDETISDPRWRETLSRFEKSYFLVRRNFLAILHYLPSIKHDSSGCLFELIQIIFSTNFFLFTGYTLVKSPTNVTFVDLHSVKQLIWKITLKSIPEKR